MLGLFAPPPGPLAVAVEEIELEFGRLMELFDVGNIRGLQPGDFGLVYDDGFVFRFAGYD